MANLHKKHPIVYFYQDSLSPKSGIEIKYPCIIFDKDNWNDFGYVVTYKLYYYQDSSSYDEIGTVKILDKSSRETVLEKSFTSLNDNLCSLGQSLEYYFNVKRLFPSNFEKVFSLLNDVAIFKDIAKKFEFESGFQNALIRFGSAERAFQEARLLVYDNMRKESDELLFTYSSKIKEADEAHVVEFDFVKTSDLPFRINVIIGKNGTGKTQYLGGLINAISGVDEKRDFKPFIPLFNKVIAISYSLFDDFPKPAKTTVFSYKYIGLRTKEEEVISDANLSKKLQSAFHSIIKQKRTDEWYTIVNKIVKLENLGLSNVRDLDEEWVGEISYKKTKRLSSGQSIILFILTELIANIQNESLILFDEPETHLHPSAIAELMNCFSEILETYNSFAILSTHSPIIIQDVPSRYISVFDRMGNLPIVKKLPIESFGENLSVLTNTVFEKVDVKELYKKHFEKLDNSLMTEQSINELFNNKLSFNALLYLAALQTPNNEKS